MIACGRTVVSASRSRIEMLVQPIRAKWSLWILGMPRLEEKFRAWEEISSASSADIAQRSSFSAANGGSVELNSVPDVRASRMYLQQHADRHENVTRMGSLPTNTALVRYVPIRHGKRFSERRRLRRFRSGYRRATVLLAILPA